jgi:hypothetical protein
MRCTRHGRRPPGPLRATLVAVKKPPESVLGHVLPEPRLTAAGIVLLAAWVTVPVLVVGSLLDLLVQWLFGVCVGLWCLA